jgi:asparagine synthase (glutamine-hydrolysing)
MGMAHGVEIRVPFVDRILLETFHRLPPELRLAPGKKLLRAAVPECDPLPHGIRKRGFTLPFARWLDRDWDPLPPSRMADPSIRLDSWSRQWSLHVLSCWLQRNLDWSGP